MTEKRQQGKNLTAEEREEYIERASELKAKGKNISEIARELGVERRTVRGLLADVQKYVSLDRTLHAVEGIQTYIALIEFNWDLMQKLMAKGEYRSNNITAAANVIVHCRTRIEKLAGAEAPPQIHGQVDWDTIDLKPLSPEEREVFARAVARTEIE